jgi:TRAP-type C4-dicarboxylate transport system substrate-binding protein
LPFSEVYTALGSGLLDGAKNSLPDMAGQRFYEHVKHVLEDRHSYMAALWWYSDVRWKALPPDLQAVVADGMKELASATRQAAIDRHAPAKAKFEAAGANVRVATAEEQALFAEAAGGVREWFTKKYGPEWLDKLDRAVAGCEAATAQTP